MSRYSEAAREEVSSDCPTGIATLPQFWGQARVFRPGQLSLLTVQPDEFVVTCIKKAEQGDSLIVRFYNISEVPLSGHLECWRPIESAELVNLNEEPVAPLELDAEDRVQLTDVPTRRIVTVAIQFAD